MYSCNMQILIFAFTYLLACVLHAGVARSMTSHVSCCRHFSYLQLTEIEFAVGMCRKAAASMCECTCLRSRQCMCVCVIFVFLHKNGKSYNPNYCYSPDHVRKPFGWSKQQIRLPSKNRSSNANGNESNSLHTT